MFEEKFSTICKLHYKLGEVQCTSYKRMFTNK